ncbi:hypothetical protein SAMN02949497_3545 [Methylomagnum ishizawai]|uniref:Uncharacterized protein n=1 Tax=Methylomagnum ishizawai TaxID=1760988 RepID=A0A1Y6D158_9GAMM|nr:hypothetical protein [Methylomagnum ishizawai]SMF96160.1 hypothetical protein SAMN02949497_3545 [Methylomagnum ishizawai]
MDNSLRNRRILPPYARQLDRALFRAEVMVLTGSGAQARATSRTWFPGQKVMLPFGAEIERFHWPVSGRGCLMWSDGLPEPRDRLFLLARTLIESGAPSVLLCVGERPMPLFRPRVRAA